MVGFFFWWVWVFLCFGVFDFFVSFFLVLVCTTAVLVFLFGLILGFGFRFGLIFCILYFGFYLDFMF